MASCRDISRCLIRYANFIAETGSCTSWGAAFLADSGAQVIRVESADYMNDCRSGPFPDREPSEVRWNAGGMFAYWARNKQSLCHQVAAPCGQDVYLKLVANRDIVTDNFRSGTMRRLGLDHDTLSANIMWKSTARN